MSLFDRNIFVTPYAHWHWHASPAEHRYLSLAPAAEALKLALSESWEGYGKTMDMDEPFGRFSFASVIEHRTGLI